MSFGRRSNPLAQRPSCGSPRGCGYGWCCRIPSRYPRARELSMTLYLVSLRPINVHYCAALASLLTSVYITAGGSWCSESVGLLHNRSTSEVGAHCQRLGRLLYICTHTSPLVRDCAGMQGAEMCTPVYKHAFSVASASSYVGRIPRGLRGGNAQPDVCSWWRC